jgi:hypothetical protein
VWVICSNVLPFAPVQGLHFNLICASYNVFETLGVHTLFCVPFYGGTTFFNSMLL